ncbi:adenylate kinase [Myxococcus sp. CA051A]|uniref:adenylate kinase n=1 Tax=unclassified Myxococcus TaxID=2648731 RepID=UPI00157A5122|nr:MULTISPECIES: adenylate kinase [unclassified Myxococcus]NTX14915.1 adenylate kinase [Myxococcus sp. CA056]NTX38820.1 adenylate kinase [Myxococcus sp. CA033]NTX51692.1 adenylate kinase [Myxococcus sp. CA039A]NTX67589.1 adenylate kinase [Myxococcus sp. CA051A]
MNLILLGPPNAGKGTQAKKLFADFHIPQISTGDILRKAVAEGTELGKVAGPLMAAGQYVPDEVVIGIVEERLKQSDVAQGFVLDGFPRTPGQADALERMLGRLGKQLDAVVSLEVPHKTLVERGSGRRVCPVDGSVYHVDQSPPKRAGYCDKCGTGLVQRPDDMPDVIEKRLQKYDAETAPLKAFYAKKGVLKSVDGVGSPDGIYEEIKSAAGRGKV